MNRAYKLVWNSVSNSWIVASELARGRKKSSSTALKLAVLLAGGVLAPAYAQVGITLPSGESVASGGATFDRSVSNQLTVNQSTSKLITNWNSFDVGTGGKVVFAQPDASSIALNRVTSGSASQISGQVTANGQLILVNPNGITFGAGSQVSASGIVASSLDILDSDFNAGNLLFSRGAATGSIDNKGSLTATAGSVSLLGATVKNSGTISASGGNAALINADAVNLTTTVPSISTASSITGLIQQSGSITATQVSSVGGKILLTGDTSQSASQIQLAGTLDAITNTSVNGRSILLNGDVNLNGASNALDFTTTSGYSLTNGAALNLNGASSAFSVNGTGYTVIRDVNQLQAMNGNKAGNYVLGADIDASDTVNWNSGAGFLPIGGNGDTTSIFSGVLDGLGHTVNALSINRVGKAGIGLIGYAYSASIQNIGLTNVNFMASISASPLVGGVRGGTTNIKNVYVTGTFTVPAGAAGYLGSLVGSVGSGTAGGSVYIANSYSTLAINATTLSAGYIGGLVGSISSGSNTITDSYFTGSISSQAANIGGIFGGYVSSPNLIVLNRVYVSGALGGTSQVNGLVGKPPDNMLIYNSYWNTETTGRRFGGAGGILNDMTGLTTAQSKLLSSYANWGSSIDAQGGTGSTWRIYEGYSGPLLRSFLKPLSISANNVTKTYDATSYSASTAGYSADAAYDSSKLLGSAALAGTALNARNAGTYNIDINGLYSTQDGYDLNASAGTLTINKRLLTISATDASKVYDGKLTSSDKPTVVGRQRGDSIVGLTQSYLDKNAGTGKAINVDAGYTIRDGNNGNNYDVVVVNSTAGVITPKALTISTVASTKVYDGGVTSDNKPLVTGLLSGDRVTGLYQHYETKTVGTGKKLLVKSGYVVNDGNGGGNYSVTEQGSNDGVITAN